MTHDLIIIGAGPGGLDAALYAAKHGLSVALIERHKVGGTCLNYGCIPTKALYQNAKTIRSMHNLSTFGVHADAFRLDYDTIKARKETIVSGQIDAVTMSLKKAGIDLIEGSARLQNDNTVTVGDATYQGNHVIIATGSKPKMLSFEGDDLPIIHTSKTILDLEVFPKRLLVVGAGVIGVELAQIFQSFDADVTLVDFAGDILLTEDKDVRKRARNLFKRQGIDIHTNAALTRVKQESDTYLATLTTKKGDVNVAVDAVLIAVGRAPNVGDLDLGNLGINHTPQGIRVDANKRTSRDGVYAIGDVNGEWMLAHKATYDGYRAVNHILDKTDTIRFDLVPSVIFSTPLIASVGVREDDLEGEYKTSKALFKANAKAVAMDDTDGFLKLIADGEGRLIGAHIIGNGADFLIHEITALIQKGTTISEAHDIIHSHPTVSEVVHDALRQLD